MNEAKQYQLRVPFRLLQELAQPLEPPVVWDLEGRIATVRGAAQFIALTIEPFVNEAAARKYFSHVRGALAWTTGVLGTGFTLEQEFTNPTFVRDPVTAGENVAATFGLPSDAPIDALADGSRPTIVPLGTRIRYVTAGNPTLTVRRSNASFLAAFREGLDLPGAARVISDDRLGVAVDLLGRSHLEATQASRFLSLAMALEVLAEPEKKHPVATRILEDFRSQVVAARESFSPNSDEWSALDSLSRDALFRTETSIRSRVRRLALRAFADQPDSDQQVRRAVKAYDCRSTLVHQGSVDAHELSSALEIVRELVMRTVRARMSAISQESTSAARAGGA